MDGAVDPLSISALTAALAPTFTFLYARLSGLLDRRRGIAEETPEAVETPEVLEGRLAPLQADPAVVDSRWSELLSLAGSLGVYERNPERLVPGDTVLLRDLERLRGLLEEIYGQRITFRGEQRASTGTRVRQKIRNVTGTTVGVRTTDTGYSADVDQDIDTVEAGGWVIGVQADS